MDTIYLSKDILEMMRSLEREYIYTFELTESNKAIHYINITNSSDENNANAILSGYIDGILHNHLEDSDFSDIDKDYMLPNIIYILITPNFVRGILNKENIKCESY